MCSTGQLGPVGELWAAVTSPEWLLISWAAPYSLNITDSDIDLWYSVSIFTPAGHLLPCSDCHNITNTSYSLSLTGLHNEGVYDVAVLPANAYSSASQSVRMPVYVKLVPNTHNRYSDISNITECELTFYCHV